MTQDRQPRSGADDGPGGDVPADPFGRLRAALVLAESGGIGCHYRTRSALGVPVEQLEALGLVRTIGQRIPTCEAHGCAILETCSWRVDFAEARPGRAGRKFRLTPLGSRAVEEPAILVEQVAAQPLAAAVLEHLAADGRPLGWLELYWRLLEPELDALDEAGQRPAPPLSRSGLRFQLDLLVAAGLLTEDPETGTVTRRQE